MRRRIHNKLEAAFMLAQYPDGYVYSGDVPPDRSTAVVRHVKCVRLNQIERMLDIGRKMYLVPSPIYAPMSCSECGMRNLRARKVRG